MDTYEGPILNRYKFKVGEIVRIIYMQNAFPREYDERWTRKLFITSSRFIKYNNCLCTLKDYDNKSILGTFYQEELQKVKVSNNAVYKIEKKILKRVRNNTREVLVK